MNDDLAQLFITYMPLGLIQGGGTEGPGVSGGPHVFGFYRVKNLKLWEKAIFLIFLINKGLPSKITFRPPWTNWML